MKYFINDVEFCTKEFYKKLREASDLETKLTLDDELDVFYENFRTTHPSGYQYTQMLNRRQEEAYYARLADLADSSIRLGGSKFAIEKN